jgi:hypothetical protein
MLEFRQASIQPETSYGGHVLLPIALPSDSSARVIISSGHTQAAVGDQPILLAAMQIGIEQQFQSAAERWSTETGAHSSLTMRQKHPAYRELVAMGWNAVPLLLRALKDRPDYWFPALREITGENPVTPERKGDYDKMSESWRQWGQNKGL